MMSDVENTPSGSLEIFPDDYLPAIDIDLAALAEIPKGDFDSWGATPLNTSGNLSLHLNQVAKHDLLLEERFGSVPPELGNIPPEIQYYVRRNFTTRFWGRTIANSEKYAQRLRKDEFRFSPAQREIFRRAERGEANPAEILYTQSELEIPGVELACITHPYGVHTDKLEEMREVVRSAMKLFGATIYPEDELKNIFAIKQTDHAANAAGIGKKGGFEKKNASEDSAALFVHHKGPDAHLRDAVVVTRKRDHGMLPDGKVVRERSSFIFRPRSHDERLIDAMREVILVNNNKALEQLNKIAREVELDRILMDLIREKVFDVIIPLSTTIYSFDTEITDERKRRNEAAARIRNIGARASVAATDAELLVDGRNELEALALGLNSDDDDL